MAYVLLLSELLDLFTRLVLFDAAFVNLRFLISGLRILAFPCDQFNHQEPGNAEEIQCFARDRKVKFDLFDKINVNGDDAAPLWKYLKKEQGGMLFDGIKWNFTKFIVDKNGKPVERHAPTTSPKEMLKNLEAFL